MSGLRIIPLPPFHLGGGGGGGYVKRLKVKIVAFVLFQDRCDRKPI